MTFLNLAPCSSPSIPCQECGSPALVSEDDAGGSYREVMCLCCGLTEWLPMRAAEGSATISEKADGVLWTGYPNGSVVAAPVNLPCDLAQEAFDSPQWAYVVHRDPADNGFLTQLLLGNPPSHDHCVAKLLEANSEGAFRPEWRPAGVGPLGVLRRSNVPSTIHR